MVDFAIFNEKSLSFLNLSEVDGKFIEFFSIVGKLSSKGIHTIRMDKDFKNYAIAENVTFQQYFGQLRNKELRDRLRIFISNGIVKIESPLIKDAEEENEEFSLSQYSYKSEVVCGGLACCDIWDTIGISFNSDDEWDKHFISLSKDRLSEDGINSSGINVRHASNPQHLEMHTTFFNQIEEFHRLNITPTNFWSKRNELFPNKIVFCPEVEAQVRKLDSNILKQAINTLRKVELEEKSITDYNMSPEKETVKTNPKMREQRLFTKGSQKVFFSNHLKNLPNGNRIYFIEEGTQIFIGYIGSHLTNKNDK